MPRALVAALLASFALAVPTAAADSNADEAEARFRRGRELFKTGKYDEALLEFFASNRLVSNRNVIFNIASTFDALARYEEAYRYYGEYLASQSDTREREATRAKLEELAPRLALLHVVSDPDGATIYLDRKDLGGHGETPLTLAPQPGKHVVIVERDGYTAFTAEVDLARGKTASIQAKLEKIVGTIEIVSAPSAEVRVDRPDDDRDPPDEPSTPATLRLSPGTHVLELRADGFVSRRREVVVTADGPDASPQRVFVKLTPEPAAQGTLIVTGNVADAMVTVDGEVLGFTPTAATVRAGTHVVSVTSEGYEPWEREVNVPRDQRVLQEADLVAIEPEVVGAMRTAQRVADAPASVTLIGADELYAFGYETLAEALRGVRGLYESDDRSYRSVGFRGFSPPGDYTTRVLVMRDGHVVNEDWLGSGAVGRDFAADLEDVERIEVIRGPGSAFYGPGAFFGVVNVVSRPPAAEGRVRAGAGIGSNGGSRVFGSSSVPLPGGARAAVHASAYASRGQTLYFDEFLSSPSGGFVRDADAEHAERVALRVDGGQLTLDASWNQRTKDVPTAAFGSVFDPRRFADLGGVVTQVTDRRAWVEGRLAREVRGADLALRLSYDHFSYEGRYPYDRGGAPFLLADEGGGDWAGLEARVTTPPFVSQRLTVGLEGAGHRVGMAVDRDSDGDFDFHDDRQFTTAALYALDDLRVGDRLQITAGARYDRWGVKKKTSVSPRVSAVVSPYEGGRSKVVLGQALRAASVYELYFQDDLVQEPSGGLEAEKIQTGEVEHTHLVSERAQVQVGVFASRIQGLVGLVQQPSPGLLKFVNSDEAVWSFGAEAEVQATLDEGISLTCAASASAFAGGDDRVRVNSLPLSAVAKFLWPIKKGSVWLAGELVYNSPRELRDDGETEHVLLGNVVASGATRGRHLRWRAGVYNVLDWEYGVAVGEEYVQRAITQDGRSFFVELSYEY